MTNIKADNNNHNMKVVQDFALCFCCVCFYYLFVDVFGVCMRSGVLYVFLAFSFLCCWLFLRVVCLVCVLSTDGTATARSTGVIT